MEFVEEHLFEMMIGGTFALGWVSCYLNVFEVRGDRKKLEKGEPNAGEHGVFRFRR